SRFSSFATVPFLGDFHSAEGAVIDMHLGQFALKIPATVEIHPDTKRMTLVVITGVRAGAHLLIVEKECHRLAAASDEQMMPSAIAELLRAGGRTGATSRIKGKSALFVCADHPAVAQAADAFADEGDVFPLAGRAKPHRNRKRSRPELERGIVRNLD